MISPSATTKSITHIEGCSASIRFSPIDFSDTGHWEGSRCVSATSPSISSTSPFPLIFVMGPNTKQEFLPCKKPIGEVRDRVKEELAIAVALEALKTIPHHSKR
ncbi:MAG: hypothetical protein HY860_06235 [Chlamydiales bacterium]|nr:hypothetical protein [Chlamydiales bacterium]